MFWSHQLLLGTWPLKPSITTTTTPNIVELLEKAIALTLVNGSKSRGASTIVIMITYFSRKEDRSSQCWVVGSPATLLGRSALSFSSS